MIAHMFARAANIRILLESPEPRYPPLGDPKQNSEDDLDFTILTGQGDKLMELTEFAPLQQHGPKFKDAPQEAPLIWPTPEVLITSRFLSKRFDHRESRPTTPARHSVAPIIIPLGAAWPPVDGSIGETGSTIEARLVLLQDCTNLPPLPCSARWRLSSRTSR
jgi:hypothetical protein